jgi:hypothetical protein
MFPRLYGYGANLVNQAREDGDPPRQAPRPGRISMIVVDFMHMEHKIHHDHGNLSM